jgi:hypothetical protein
MLNEELRFLHQPGGVVQQIKKVCEECKGRKKNLYPLSDKECEERGKTPDRLHYEMGTCRTCGGSGTMPLNPLMCGKPKE